MKTKKAAMEMSVGTLVTIVLLVSVLVLGMILVRSIMCSGIVLTDQIDEKVQNELENLFGYDDYGVKCMGEAGQQINLGDGGKRQVICVFNLDKGAEYSLTVESIESLEGVNRDVPRNWIIDKDWQGRVSAGTKTVPVLVLNIPRDIDSSNLKIIVEEENQDTSSKETHTMYIDVSHVSGFNAAMC